MERGRMVAAAIAAVVVLAGATPAFADSWSTGTTGQITTPLTSGSSGGPNTKVGLGVTASPSAQVEIRSNTTDNNVGRITLKVNQVRTDADIVRFQQNGSTKVSINATGVLQADNGVKIKTWSMEVPDYVFDGSRYKLTSLDDVDRFIKREGHLPDMPSASQLQESGMDLAEMNLRLLKKVEELTLYTIAQDRKIRKLAARIDAKQAAKPIGAQGTAAPTAK